MKWTREKPTKPGWYWYKCGCEPVTIYIYESAGILKVDNSAEPEYHSYLKDYDWECWWSDELIPEPETPKGAEHTQNGGEG